MRVYKGIDARRNPHKTVKPIGLMEWLAKLTRTPNGGVVFDPFAGTGTTGIGAAFAFRTSILAELDPVYYDIARRRLDHWIKKPRQLTLINAY